LGFGFWVSGTRFTGCSLRLAPFEECPEGGVVPSWEGCPEGGVGLIELELTHPYLLRQAQHRPPKEGISEINDAKSLHLSPNPCHPQLSWSYFRQPILDLNN